MGIKNLNEYRIDYEDNTQQIFMAENSRAVTKTLETDQRQIVQLSRIKTGVGVQTPVRSVKFITAIMPEGAAVNKCRAVPETWVVPEETKVIFTAIPADGYKFDGWFKKGADTPLSEETTAELLVEYPEEPNAVYAEFEAHFSPII